MKKTVQRKGKTEIKSSWEKKVKSLEAIVNALEEYPVVIVIETSQATSAMLNNVRSKLRKLDDKTTLIFAKRTIYFKAIDFACKKNPVYKDLKESVNTGICGLIFSYSDPQRLVSLIKSECQWEDAIQGRTCPVDIYLPKGGLGLDPTKTSFFPALNIATKISRGQVEVINDSILTKKGEVVSSSVASLLRTLKMKPIPKVFIVKTIFNRGVFLNPDDLIEQDTKVLKRFTNTLRDMECLCTAINYPTKLNFMRTLWKGYTNLFAVCMETNLSFAHGEKIIMSVLVNQLKRNGNWPE
jgi:large subunit ribosomal protein LP0